MEKIALDFIAAHAPLFKIIGYYVVLVSGFIESLPVIGFFIPGQTIIIIGGFFAKRKAVGFLLMFLAAVVGAILGDLTSFLLGRRYGEAFLRKHGSKFFVKESLIESTKKLVHTHPGKTLFFGRLNGVTRSLAPFIAGASKIDTATFLFYCITGCTMWAGIFVSIGYIFGRSFEVAAPVVGKFILFATIIVGLLILLVQYMKKRGFTLSNYDIQMLVTNIVSLYIFTSLAQALGRASAILAAFDTRTALIITHLHTHFLDLFFIALAGIQEPDFIACVSLLCLFLVLEKRVRESAALLLSILSGSLMVLGAKIIFDRSRPLGGLVFETSSSFPSGHATLSTLLFLVLIHTFASRIKNKTGRYAFVTGSIFCIALISFSRLYLNVHYATDVIAGMALGAWVFSLSLLASKCAPWFYKKIKREQIIPNM